MSHLSKLIQLNKGRFCALQVGILNGGQGARIRLIHIDNQTQTLENFAKGIAVDRVMHKARPTKAQNGGQNQHDLSLELIFHLEGKETVAP